jgi:aspartyl-tRNA synthetase
LASELRSEFCVGLRGVVHDRGERRNPNLPTGEVEIHCTDLTIFSRSDTPPFEINDNNANESIRLKYRALDLRRPALQKNFLLRSQIYQTARRVLTQHKFLEIETPFLVKYTPGGARNFLVPSRLSPGSSTPWPNRPSSSSSCSWWRASTATSRSSAASATRTCARIASPSSRRSTPR